MNEYELKLDNGQAWVYADDYHTEPATSTHAARYVFTRGMRTVETIDAARVISITENPETTDEASHE